MANIYSNQKVVTTSGTPVQLPSQTVDPDQTAVIKAKSANTGTICVGYSSVTALNSNASHFKLAANEGIELNVMTNLNEVWIDSTVNGEGVEILIG